MLSDFPSFLKPYVDHHLKRHRYINIETKFFSRFSWPKSCTQKTNIGTFYFFLFFLSPENSLCFCSTAFVFWRNILSLHCTALGKVSLCFSCAIRSFVDRRLPFKYFAYHSSIYFLVSSKYLYLH